LVALVALVVGCGGSSGSGGGGSIGDVFPCTEQGIRDAIAVGGGPHTFDCDGPTTVVTEAGIVIRTSVILDGEGKLTLEAKLTVDAEYPTRVLSVRGDGPAELRGVTLRGGRAYGSSGILNKGVLTVVDSEVTDNRGERRGGGILNEGELTLINTRVSGNTTAAVGGGIYNSNGAVLTLIESTVSANHAPHAKGGGIDNHGMLTLTNSTVASNTAGFGGGIMNAGGTLTLTNSTVSGNTAAPAPLESTAGGGGIANTGTLTLTDSTVSGNTATEGGGIWNGIGTLTLANSTVARNIAGYGSGISASSEGALTLINTLIDNDCEGKAPTSGGGNLESPGDTCGFDQPTDQVNVSAGALALGPLQGNGGPTETHALGAGSVAIDQIPAVDCEVTEDQRGFPRDSMCDVGAFEVQP
jgi:hypothetical protein